MSSKRKRIGRRMRELCFILRYMGGEARSMRAVYMQLRYGEGGRGTSNRFGYDVMERCVGAGLIERLPEEGGRVPVRLTIEGWEVAESH